MALRVQCGRHMRRNVLLCAALAATPTVFGCAPRSEEAASSEEALTTTQLAGTYWKGDASGSFAWLEIQSGTGALVYRAERRNPWRIETGEATLTNGDLVLARGNVTERFKANARGATLKLTVGSGGASLSLQKTTREPAAGMGAALPFNAARAVRGIDGKVYGIDGARPADGEVTRFASFDPATSTSSELPAVPKFAQKPAMVAGADGRIYLFGGADDSVLRHFTGAYAFVQAFDVRANEWLALPALPKARAGAGAAACPDGRILVVGGYRTESVSMAYVTVYDKSTVLYDPRTGKSSAGADGPALVYPAVTSSPSGIIYVVGGDLDPSTAPDPSYGAYAYDCRANTWTTLPNMPSGRTRHGALTDERGRLFVFGGNEGGNTMRPRPGATLMFDPKSLAWSTVSYDGWGNGPAVLMGPGVFWSANGGQRFLDPNGGAR